MIVSLLDRRLCVEVVKKVLFIVDQQHGGSEPIRDQEG